MSRFLFTIVFLGTLLFTSELFAHTKSQSFSSWDVSGARADVTFAVDRRRVTQLSQLYDPTLALEEMLALHLAETLSVRQKGKVCAKEGFSAAGSDPSIIRMTAAFVCEQSIERAGAIARIAAFHTVSATHVHIARVSAAGEEDGREFLLSETTPFLSLDPNAPPQSILGFGKLGFSHVLSGVDHLAFIAALALLAGSVRRSIFAMTGFTLGHSLTLALVVLGLTSPEGRLIEAMIGFTIAATALEVGAGAHRKMLFTALAAVTLLVCLTPVGPTAPPLIFALGLSFYAFSAGRLNANFVKNFAPLIAALFGMVHGAGFAGGLMELNLSGEHIVGSLIGFNLGVEAGQLLMLAVMFVAVKLAQRLAPSVISLAPIVSALGLFTLGVFWFAERIWS